MVNRDGPAHLLRNVVPNRGNWIRFVREADGRVTGFSWSSGRVRKVWFTKR